MRQFTKAIGWTILVALAVIGFAASGPITDYASPARAAAAAAGAGQSESLLASNPSPAGAVQTTLSFRSVAPQGFYDRQNSKAWSMIWWKGDLYVGTARSHMCVEYWALAKEIGWPFVYPPTDPDVECTENPQDLPLQAEIWRYSPEIDFWERVFQSPNDVPIPQDPNKYTARDIGFRGITAFTDPDGTEALYIGGTTSESINPGMPPPRILRSTDGETWLPVPQDPGTLLGDLGRGQANFRGMVVHQDRLYVVNGALRGGGELLESVNPAGGNDNFWWITPADTTVYEVISYNNQLYLGTQRGLQEPQPGYQVLRMQTSGPLPYPYTVVIDDGAWMTPLPSNVVVSMYEYGGRLYVGTDKPAEMIRINPDDTWDLIVGTPRETPDGWKGPLSGFGNGFDYLFNEHIWRMDSYDGELYVGTNDATGFAKEYAWAEPFLQYMGYDLFVSPNGIDYTKLTRTGFGDEGTGDRLDIGIRVFAPTPYGLFFGTSNHFYGLHIMLGEEVAPFRAYLPLVARSVTASGGLSQPLRALQPPTSNLQPPTRLALENHPVAGNGAAAVLSWEAVPNARFYHIFRSTFVPAEDLGLDAAELQAFLERMSMPVPDKMRIPQPFVEIGVTDRPFFVDQDAEEEGLYHYYVQAENSRGIQSPSSNLVRSPALNPPVTLSAVRQAASEWIAQNAGEAAGQTEPITAVLAGAEEQVNADNLRRAMDLLEPLRADARLNRLPELSWWRAEDLERLLGTLIQRIRLAEAGILSPSDLN